jgi:protein arginine kinase activator
MKCEICHNADAEQAIMKSIGGPEQELYVCSGCAAQAQKQKEKPASLKKKPSDNAAEPEVLPEGLPELVGMIIDATLEIMNHPVLSGEAVCPHCGITRSEYRKASRLGCSTCYETFARELGNLIADMHHHPLHTGKAPRRPAPSKEVRKLMRRLKAAEVEDRVKEALKLRENIRSLGWEPDAIKGET